MNVRPRPRSLRLAATRVALPAVLAIVAHTARAQAPAAAPSADAPLTLGQVARLAAERSAPARAARLRAEQADARVTQRRADLLPNLSLAAGESGRTFNTASFGLDIPTGVNPVTGRPNPPIFDPRGQVAGPVQLYDLRGRLASNLLDLGAVERVRAARTLASASDADADAQAEGAAATAAVAFLRAQRADAQLANRVADSTLAAELLGIARQQLRAGVGVALDVTRAESQLAGVRAQLIAARNDRARARLDLQRLLDLPLDRPLRLADSLAALPTTEPVPNVDDAVRTALARRPDLVVAERQLEASRRQALAIRAERLPSVSGFVDQGNTGLGLDGRLLPTYTWGVQVSVPVFDGFRREGRLEEARAQAAEADVRRRDLETQAAVDVRGALLDLASAGEQLDAARERQRLAEQEVAQARDRFRAGVAGNADVVTASLSLTAARTATVDALTLYQNARVALARAQGLVTRLP